MIEHEYIPFDIHRRLEESWEAKIWVHMECKGAEIDSLIVLQILMRSISMGAVENDRKHDDLCVGSMGIRPMNQQRTS